MVVRLLLVVLLFREADGAKIGVFTAPLSNSQMVFTLRLAESLADDGHEVVLIRPEYNPDVSVKSNHPKIKEISTKAAPLVAWNTYNDIKHRENFEDWGFWDYKELGSAVMNLWHEGCRGILANDSFIEEIGGEKFEVAFHHHLDFCLHGVAYAVGVRKWFSTSPLPLFSQMLEDLGIPYQNSFLPGLVQNTTMEKSFVQRLQTSFMDLVFHLIIKYTQEKPTTQMLKEKFGDNVIGISELRKQAILTFVNSDPFLEYPIPVTDKIQYIGGLGTKSPKALKEPFLSFAERAERLVVVSFGSVVTAASMPKKWRDSFVELFEKNPEISFIWKFEENLAVPKNVLRTRWFPQNELLALNKTVAFITHGGYNSLGEAVQSGTPCIFIPLSTDQHRNSILGHYRGIGLQLPKSEISSDNLHYKLRQILTNPIYHQRAKKYQKLANSRLNSPDEVLRHWTKLALDNELEISLPDLNTIELYNIDVYSVFVITFIGILIVARTILRRSCSFCRRSPHAHLKRE